MPRFLNSEQNFDKRYIAEMGNFLVTNDPKAVIFSLNEIGVKSGYGFGRESLRRDVLKM